MIQIMSNGRIQTRVGTNNSRPTRFSSALCVPGHPTLLSRTLPPLEPRTAAPSKYARPSIRVSGLVLTWTRQTYNGAIAIDENGNPCGTVLEAAKLAGYKTGLVVTSRITHATPASFASHIYDRDAEDQIALQLVGYQPLNQTGGRPITDIMLGGGLSFFLPNSTAGSLRKDGLNLLDIAKKAGVNAFSTRSEFDKLSGLPGGGLPYLGVFTPGHMAYEVCELTYRVATIS